MVRLVLRERRERVADRAAEDLARLIEGRAKGRVKARRNFTHVDEQGRVYLVSRLAPGNPPRLEWVSIQTFTDSTLVQRLDARSARWETDHWLLQEGFRRDFDAAGQETVTPFASLPLEVEHN